MNHEPSILLIVYLGLVLTLLFSQNSGVSTGLNEPQLVWKIRAYGAVSAVSITQNGDHVVASVHTGPYQDELQLYENDSLIWKKPIDNWTRLVGFTSEGEEILAEQTGLSGLQSFTSLLFFSLSGDLVKKLTIITPSGSLLTGSKIANTNLTYRALALSDDGFIALIDEGESEYYDKGICYMDTDGVLLWRSTLIYPEVYEDVWIPHDGKYVLAMTFAEGNRIFRLFNSTGYLLCELLKRAR